MCPRIETAYVSNLELKGTRGPESQNLGEAEGESPLPPLRYRCLSLDVLPGWGVLFTWAPDSPTSRLK